MCHILAKILRWLNFTHFDFITKKSKSYPLASEVNDEEIIFVTDSGVQKWACLRCPGQCGAVISLSLNQNRSPKWTLTTDLLNRSTLKPSIHQTNKCGCHFWITKGQVIWCKNGKPQKYN
ncbi:conserved hypothetical protein [Pectobacterium parmentieri WPP163]|uniref:DUF6527 family protein n=1 Tax=Pectobacterium parmentieri TaxID=1905730 RepID=UPI0001BA0E12|nr:DUF6527 family protein [Pectobacterium parmentieri]ACX87197.1 conserved hypothetical protein [Pectobacterium parmentieri WPP163]